MGSNCNFNHELKKEMEALAQRYGISLRHLYHIIDCWCASHYDAITNGLFPTIHMENLFFIKPKTVYFRRKIRVLWKVYRNGSKRYNILPKDPVIINTIIRYVKVLKRLKLEKL